MRRTALALVLFTSTIGFAACGKVASDSDPIATDAASSSTPTNDAGDGADVFSVCPPAPALFPGPLQCMPGLKCEFGAPALVQYNPATQAGVLDSCNSIIFDCVPARILSPDGGGSGDLLAFEQTLVGCPKAPPRICPGDMMAGTTCSKDKGNSVCVAPGPDADLEAGVANGNVCACDKPGPVWRCLPLTTFTVTDG